MVCDGPKRVREQNLMGLWQRARGVALRRCAGTLARLARGDGGFYDADDLMQDLFLEFWRLVSALAGKPVGELWSAWESLLWRGGIRILRRRPQRLWRRREMSVPPHALALQPGGCVESRASAGEGSPLPRAARTHLVCEGSEGRVYAHDLVSRLGAALDSLSPLQRQVLYLYGIRGLSGAAVAERLRLGNANAVYQRVARARAMLRRRVRTNSSRHLRRRSHHA